MNKPTWHSLRIQLLCSSLLQVVMLFGTISGIALLLPVSQRVQAVPVTAASLLQEHAMNTAPVTLAGLAHDASGIAWNDNSGTLFAVRNKEPVVVELDTDGQLLRRIELHGFHDVEGITWISGQYFAVVEERDCSVWLMELRAGVNHVHRGKLPLFALPGLNASRGNSGCEDLAWNPQEQVFYLVREKSPAMLLRVSGVDLGRLGQTGLTVQEMAANTPDAVLGTDLSGLFFEQSSGHLLVLSDESRRITGIQASDGVSLSDPFELGWWRNGLSRQVSQPEGVTMDSDGNLYVLSEPATLYRFTR